MRVKSLARARAFLHTHGVLARAPAAEVMLDPSKVFGIKMRLVQQEDAREDFSARFFRVRA